MNQKSSQNETKPRKASFLMYIFTFSALASAMSMGSVLGWSSGAIVSLEKNGSVPQIHSHSTSDQDAKTWISSCITLGALSGALISSFITGFLGRKIVLLLLGIPFVSGWLIISFAKSFILIIVGRIITGFCAGIASSTAPGYVAEIVTPGTRGFLGSCFQLFVCIGIEFSACLGAFLPWNQTPLPSLVFPIICSLGMFFAPESPQTLANKNKLKEAHRALVKLRSSDSDINIELYELEQRAQKNRNTSSSGLGMLKRPDVYKPAIIGIALQFFQQFSGINGIMFYLTPVFKESGSSIDPQLAAIIVNFTLIVACLISGLIIDKCGRKLLLILSSIGDMFSLALLGFYYWKITPNHSWIPVVSLILFVTFFSFGMGPIPWMITGETTPSEASVLVGTLATATNWSMAFLITKEFEALIKVITKQGIYFFFAGFSFITTVYTFFLIPETRGKSIEQMQNYFSGI